MGVQIDRYVDEGSLMPKKDAEGRIFFEIRCQHQLEDGSTCNGWLIDLYIRDGRVRMRCRRSKCGRITVMVFRPKRKKDGAVDPGLTK